MLRRANRALLSAELLFRDGDTDGASNRAYYAMHEAATAALLLAEAQPMPKTHAGLIAKFGEIVVGQGLVEREHGATLNRSRRIRELADYSGDGVDAEMARAMIAGASAFVVRIEEMIAQEKPER
ncbi:MAG: HEPN domain-containing protein [Beijerinckiaceae bacterium]